MASSPAQPAANDALVGGRGKPAAIAEVPSSSEQPWLARRRRGWLVRRALLAADTCGLVLACVATEVLLGPPASGSAQNLSTSEEVGLFLLTIPIWVLLAKVYGLYERDEERPAHTTADDLAGVFNLVTVGVWAIAVGAWATKWLTPDFGRLAFFWAAAIVLVVIARSIARGIVRRTSSYRQRTLIVGGDRIGQLLAEKLVQRPESGIELVGYATERQPGNGLPALHGLPVLGTPRELPSIVSRSQIDRVIVTELDESDAPAVVRSLRARNVQVDLVPRPLEATGLSGSMHILDGVPLLGLSPMRLSQSSLVLKRTMDVVISGVGLLLLAPFMALIALLIKLDSRGPVFYRHDRIGRNGRPIRLLKFRTMKTEHCRGADYGGQSAEEEFERLMQDPTIRAEFESNYKLRDDPRITRFGAFLRRTSLDELPQLLNVLRGELSLVGPRPIVAGELGRYEPDVRTLLALRPGMTGYWQISGRSDSGYAERVRLDLAYTSNWSLQLDFSILLHTLRLLLLSRRGAY